MFIIKIDDEYNDYDFCIGPFETMSEAQQYAESQEKEDIGDNWQIVDLYRPE